MTAAGAGKQLPVNARSVLVRSVRSNGTVRNRTWCELKGNRLPRRVAQRLCAIRTNAAGTSVDVTATANAGIRISAAPTCNTGLKIHTRITAKKAGHPRATWTRTWKPDPTPRLRCRITATG